MALVMGVRDRSRVDSDGGMTNPAKTIGERLRVARDELGLSLVALEQRTLIPRTRLSRIERDETPPRPSELVRLARTLKVQVGWIVNEQDEQEATDA